MKAKTIITIIVLLFLGVFIQAQTQEEIEKMKRIQDSIMNLPQYKDMMQQLQQMKDMQDQQQVKKVKHQSEKKKVVTKKTSNDDWYWENTIASTNNKFDSWTGGAADIALPYLKQNQLTYKKIGSINVDGSIVFNLPNNFATQISLERQIGPQGMFFDIYDSSSVNYTNKDTGFITSVSLFVMRNDERIGNLTIGNSVRVTHNLNNQGGVDSGDEGYILYWAYAHESCGITLDQNWKGKVRKDGTHEKEVETNVNYNLNFKPGWNLVKTEVIGNYPLEHERGLDRSWFKAHKHTIIANMPSDAIYYYRAQLY